MISDDLPCEIRMLWCQLILIVIVITGQKVVRTPSRDALPFLADRRPSGLDPDRGHSCRWFGVG